MSRIDFEYVPNVPINDILLDISNARIRAGQDQNDCISRILRKEDQLFALMQDIAQNGLTTMPILVQPTGDGKWVVKDGNRRVTALKLLNEPEKCPQDRLKSRIQAIRKKYLSNISSEVDVLSSENKEAIIKEVLARHDGGADGAGQLDWSAYLRTVYLLNNGHPAEYKRPGQYAFWAEQQGIAVDDTFPISALQRFFTVENLELLGFKIKDDQLIACIAPEAAKKIAQTVINAFQTGERKTDDVRSPEQATAYIAMVRTTVGLVNASPTEQPQTRSPTSKTASLSLEPRADEFTLQSSNGNTNSSQNTSTPDLPTTTPLPPRSVPSPKSASWDRIRVFSGRSPNISVPQTESKAYTIVAELRLINVKETPLAAALLLRSLIEISDENFRRIHHRPDKNKLAKNVLASATFMRDSAMLDSGQFDMVSRLTGNGQDSLLQIETLQKIVHRDTHHPNYQLINTFWDNVACFVRACWDK
jgi:hypothetical protein